MSSQPGRKSSKRAIAFCAVKRPHRDSPSAPASRVDVHGDGGSKGDAEGGPSASTFVDPIRQAPVGVVGNRLNDAGKTPGTRAKPIAWLARGRW